MKTLLLLLNLLLIFPHAFSAQTECEPGYVFDTARNFCVISSGSIEANTKAKECEGLSGQAYQDCFDKNVKDSLEANNINGDVSDPKQNGLHMAASIVTTSFGVYALVRGKELKACGKTSVYMIAAGGVTALLGEALAKRGYKKTLDNDSDKEDKKGLKQKYIASLEASDSNTEEGVDNLSQNQILAFDFQRDQELAKEKAHTSRKKVNEWAGGIYAAAGAVAIYEAIANGWALSATGDCKPTFKRKRLTCLQFIQT